MDMPDDTRAGNPFSTRFTRPGRLVYRFPPGMDAARLCRQLESSGWCGAIVGDHGTGKTTLLHSLVPRLEQHGRVICWFTLRAGDKKSPVVFPPTPPPGLQIVVDGYEQLGWWARRSLQRQCQRRRAGLLVTTHQASNLPTLWHTQPSLQLLRRLVAQLLNDHEQAIDDQVIAGLYDRHQGNIRETLFSLYDCYERNNAH
jgi:hypothetical protein